MVRLKALTRSQRERSLKRFQFQYGAIKRCNGFGVDCAPIGFQFQYGAIKRRTLCIHARHVLIFQFQYGAIKRCGSFLAINYNL